jgi:anti-sigma B factor antagonist
VDYLRGDHYGVTATHDDDRVAFTLTGEIDWDAATAIRPAVLNAAADASSITVDLSQVTFLDSTGLALLVGLHKQAAPTPLVVTGATDRTWRVIQTSGLDKVFELRER